MSGRRLWITAIASYSGAIAIGALAIFAAVESPPSAISPFWVAAGLTAAIGIPVALRFPDVAVVALIVADLGKLSEVTADMFGVGVFQPLLFLTIASLLLAFATGRLKVRWSLFYLPLLALAAVVGASVLAAGASSTGFEALQDLIKDIVYLGVLLVWATTRSSWKLATGAVVATLAGLAILSLVQEFLFDNSTSFFGLSNVQTTQTGAFTQRHSGPEVDANFWARSLAMALPLGLSWWAAVKPGITRWLAGGAVAAIAVGLYLTQSRGGLLAAIGGVLLWLALAGPPYSRLLKLAPIAVAIVLVIPGVGSRLLTLTDSVDPSLEGRVGAQQTGIGMFVDNPLSGVGYGDFTTVASGYQRELGIPGEALDAHNLYLEIAAETGAIGLAVWALVIGYALFATLRALLIARLSGSAEDRWAQLMAAGIAAGLMAWLAASLFLHAASLRVLFTALAVGVGMDVAFRGEAVTSMPFAGRQPSDVADGASGAPERYMRSILIGGVVFAAVAAASLWVVGSVQSGWKAETQVQLRLGDQADGRFTAYGYDLLGRNLVGTTFAAILEEPLLVQQTAASLDWDAEAIRATTLETSYSPSIQVINITATAPTPSAARDLAVGVARRGSVLLADLEQPFVIDMVEMDVIRAEPTNRVETWQVAAAALLGTLAAATVSSVMAKRERKSPMSSRAAP